MNNPKLSVIVPVYNVEKYLDHCLKSIAEQEYKNTEIIVVVDDTCNDCSEQVADEYVSKDNRVIKVMRGHKGLGDARNYGMDFVTGEYTIFVDSDDFFCSNTYFSDIVGIIERDEPDYLITRYRKYDEKNNKTIFVSEDWDRSIIESSDVETKMIHVLDSGSFGISAWAKAYKTSFLKDNNLTFKAGYSEDIEWTGKILNLTNKIAILYSNGYSYLIRKDSLSKSRNLRMIEDVIAGMTEWGARIKGNSEYENAQRGYLAYYYYIVLGLIPYLNKDDRKRAYEMAKSVKQFSAYSRSKKAKASHFLCKITGTRVTSIILNRYIRMGSH